MPIDTEAQFTDVYRSHYEDVLRFVRRRAHPMNVDDIVGETFLAAWRRRRELPEDPRPWLFGTARKVMLNAHRGMRRHTALAVRVQQAAEAGGHDRAADPAALVDGRTDLAAAWQELAPADQEVLALHVWEQLSAKDAAKVLGCTRSPSPSPTARPARSRARSCRHDLPRGSDGGRADVTSGPAASVPVLSPHTTAQGAHPGSACQRTRD